MSREIKFRAYDKWRGEYLSAGQIYLSIEPGARPAPGKQYLDEISRPNAHAERFVIEQFTSLVDKNGREIYEGDIIKTDFDADNAIVVRFVRGAFAFLWNDSLDDELPTSAPTQEWAIVAGNIHDNPDLLAKGGGE